MISKLPLLFIVGIDKSKEWTPGPYPTGCDRLDGIISALLVWREFRNMKNKEGI